MTKRAQTARPGQPRRAARADVASLRAKAAKLYAEGLDASAVASALGITPRRARQLKADVGPALRKGADLTIDAIVEGGNAARAVFVEHGKKLARVLVDGALGRLEVGDTPALRRAMREQGVKHMPTETDPQMIRARGQLAGMALGFILAQKADLHVTGAASLVAEITALARRSEGDREP